eukprot:7169526-Pyramimonas_sp.AAC.1
MRSWANKVDLHAGFGDVEAEVLYMRIKEQKPAAELGFRQRLCKMWILHALEKNGRMGKLVTFDIVDDQHRQADIEPELAANRWQLTIGDL